MMLYIYIDAACIMSLEGSSLNGIAVIFSQTSQITSGVLRLSFSLITCAVNLESLKLELLWSIMSKLTPCCTETRIFSRQLFSRQYFTGECFLVSVCFWRKERAKFLDKLVYYEYLFQLFFPFRCKRKRSRWYQCENLRPLFPAKMSFAMATDMQPLLVDKLNFSTSQQ